MRLLTAVIVIGPLMLTGAMAAPAGQSSPSGTQVQASTAGDATADRETYTRKARDDMQQWQQKLHDFGEDAKAKGQQADSAAGSALDAAWKKTRAEADKLQAASAEDWDSTRASYENASRKLADAWDKVRR